LTWWKSRNFGELPAVRISKYFF